MKKLKQIKVVDYKPIQIGVDVLGFPTFWMMPYYKLIKSKHSKKC